MHYRNMMCLIFVAQMLLSACSSENTIKPELKFGLIVGESIDSVKSKVKGDRGSWEIVDNNSLGIDDKRPPFNILRVDTKVFSDGGFSGVTRLGFYNDKLYSIWFYPDELSSYISYIEKTFQISVENSSYDNIVGLTRIRVNRDHTGKYYVSWESVKILKEIDRWISKYS